MAMDIPLKPQIPTPLYFAAQRRQLVPFVGAGLSMLAGAPNWSGFATQAFNPLIQAQKFTHSARELLKGYPDRIRLSIASNLQDDKTTISYDTILHPDKSMKSENGRMVYGHLGKLSKVFVTTNYDNWLATVFPDPLLRATSGSNPDSSKTTTSLTRKRYHLPEDLKPEYLLQDDVVFHLHGSVQDETKMVVTTRDYLRHYSSRLIGSTEQNQVLVFLKHLFDTYHVLFVGYSLSELEILEYVIQKSSSSASKPLPQHYLLMGFYNHEAQIVDHLSAYYRDLGVILLPFRRDERDHEQIIDVLEDLSKQVQVGAKTDVADAMRNLLNG